MKELYEYRRLLLERFSHTTVEMETLLASIPAGAVPQDVFLILEHLCFMETQTFLPRILRLSKQKPEGQKLWTDLDLDELRCSADWLTLMKSYLSARRFESQAIADLPAQVWSNQERHPAWGKRTLQWWVETSQAHTREHLQEIHLLLQPVEPKQEEY